MATHTQTFTPSMRDKQALGEDPYERQATTSSSHHHHHHHHHHPHHQYYASSTAQYGSPSQYNPSSSHYYQSPSYHQNRRTSGGGGGGGGGGMVPRQAMYTETCQDRERSGFAARVLDDPERLLYYAQARGETVTNQRLQFTKMLCGLEDTIGGPPAPPSMSKK